MWIEDLAGQRRSPATTAATRTHASLDPQVGLVSAGRRLQFIGKASGSGCAIAKIAVDLKLFRSAKMGN